MQRQTGRSRSVEPPRRRIDESTELPMYYRRSGDLRRGAPWYRSPEKLVHLIPFVVALCLFILWLFSHPVKVEIKNGKLVAVHRIAVQEIPLFPTTNHASTSPPLTSEMQMVSSEDLAELTKKGEAIGSVVS